MALDPARGVGPGERYIHYCTVHWCSPTHLVQRVSGSGSGSGSAFFQGPCQLTTDKWSVQKPKKSVPRPPKRRILHKITGKGPSTTIHPPFYHNFRSCHPYLTLSTLYSFHSFNFSFARLSFFFFPAFDYLHLNFLLYSLLNLPISTTPLPLSLIPSETRSPMTVLLCPF